MSDNKKTEIAEYKAAFVDRLWSEVPATVWLKVLTELCPESKWHFKAPEAVIWGLCPYHSDNQPSFALYLNEHKGKCFVCGKCITDIVELIKRLKHCTYLDALFLLLNRLSQYITFTTENPST